MAISKSPNIIMGVSFEDMKFLKPLVAYYKMGGFYNLPIQVENAIDSLIILMGDDTL